jgi:hypothetical protein
LYIPYTLMKRLTFYSFIILFSISLITGCAVFGRSKDFKPFDQTLLPQVVPGRTSSQEITKMFGAPNQVVKLSNGNAYIYVRTLNKSTGLWFVLFTFIDMDSQQDRIVFFFNNNDILTNFGNSLNAAEAAYGLPF